MLEFENKAFQIIFHGNTDRIAIALRRFVCGKGATIWDIIIHLRCQATIFEPISVCAFAWMDVCIYVCLNDNLLKLVTVYLLRHLTT